MTDHALPGRSTVSLKVYAPGGRLVRTLIDGKVEWAGSHSVVWKGRSDRGRAVSSGTYLVRFASTYRGRREEATRKILLLR